MPKRLKRVISLFLASLMLLSFVGVFAFAEDTTAPVLSVSAYGDEDSVINWWKSDLDGKYYLFLPDGADASALTVGFSGSPTRSTLLWDRGSRSVIHGGFSVWLSPSHTRCG